MSTKTLENETNFNEERKVVVSNQEVTSRHWRFDSIFKVIAGIIYGLFFGMLPATFIKNDAIGTNPGEIPFQEICAIIGLLAISALSLVVIFWTFKGDIKKKHPLSYNLVHLLNAVLLAVGIIVTTVMYPSSSEDRYMILGLFYLIWSVVMSLAIIGILAMYKNQYPLSWSKAPFVIFILVISSLVEVFVWLSSKAGAQNLDDQKTLWAVVALIAFIVSVLLFSLAIAYIKRFRDVLLGERTDYEIETIKDWESSRLFALVMSSAMIITFAVALIINATGEKIKFDSLALIVELALDLIIVIPYVVLISCIKFKNMKNPNKSFMISRIFKTIDNGLLLDILGWVIMAKATLLQGLLINDDTVNALVRPLMLLITFASILILYGFTTAIQVNVPNLRNTAVTVPTLAFALVLGIFIVLFSGYLYKGEGAANPSGDEVNTSISHLVFVFIPLILLVGMSVSLMIKTLIVAKIFKSSWQKQVVVDKSYLATQQQEEKNDFIGEKTKEVDLEAIEKAKEATKLGENKTSADSLRDAIDDVLKDEAKEAKSESVRG